MTSLGNSQFVIHNSRSSKNARRPGMVAEELRPGDIAVAGAGEYADWRASLLP